MGGGTWTSASFSTYSKSVGRTVSKDGYLDSSYTAQDLFKAKRIQKELDPYNVVRECCDSDEHPYTIPVILALDVTGSMGNAAAEVAKKLNKVMTDLYESVNDVEFLVMGIGDLAYDSAPIQASQFESDIRIAEQLDKIYFEAGGGGNDYESYTAAWYFGARHTSLDCWKRGKKGIIITMGDEPLNPYLPKIPLEKATGDKLQADVETCNLYEEVKKHFDVYHLAVDDKATAYRYIEDKVNRTWEKYLDKDHFKVVSLDNISFTIIDIVKSASSNENSAQNQARHENENNYGISW